MDGKNFQDWTAVEVSNSLGRFGLKKKYLTRIQQAFEAKNITGAVLENMTAEASLKDIKLAGKALPLGVRKELWKWVQFFKALPMDEGLYRILKQCLSAEKSKRFNTAGELMNKLLPLIDLAPQLHLRSRIPLSVAEEVSDNTQKIVQVFYCRKPLS